MGGRLRHVAVFAFMTSVANYLKCHGWTPDAAEAQKKAVIRKYNNSGAYTEAVLQLARLMK